MCKEASRVTLSIDEIRRLYDLLSPVYDFFTRYEAAARKKALEITATGKGFRVLEVGFGTGKLLLEFARKVGETGQVCGLDISSRMVNRARKNVESQNLIEKVDLVIGDVNNTPFLNSTFDVVLSSYLLDLVDTPNIPTVLGEFERVLRQGGRLVLVSLSKGQRWFDNMKLYEWIYARSPSLFGGCRPILLEPQLKQLSFKNVNRELIHAGYLMPTEIVWADKS